MSAPTRTCGCRPVDSVSHVQLRIGTFVPRAPVVLAPMAGVTNAPFRALCRRFGPGLVYVNEMVMATAVVHANPKTERMMTFGPDEQPRSLQLYGSDPDTMGRAVDRLGAAGLVDHVDLNFGCPAAKVTRRGGGAAVPAKPALLRAIVARGRRRGGAVRHPGHGEVPDGPARHPAHPPARRHDLRGRRRRRHRPARPHGPAALRRGRALGRDRRAQGSRHDDPRARQRRCVGGRRRGGDDAGDRL